MPSYTLFDETWARKEHFHHYYTTNPCTFAFTTILDITGIVGTSRKLYPTMLYLITNIANRHKEFRTTTDKDGNAAYFDKVLPCYTVFHKDTETFSNVWTEYTDDIDEFCVHYDKDMAEYGNKKQFDAKPAPPENAIPVSMIPWETFSSFTLNIENQYKFLLPIFTLGKYYREGNRIMMPLAIQVNHAACDGYHVSVFIKELKSFIQQIAESKQ